MLKLGREGATGISSGQRPGVLLNIYSVQDRPSPRPSPKNDMALSIVTKLRNPILKRNYEWAGNIVSGAVTTDPTWFLTLDNLGRKLRPTDHEITHHMAS